MKKIKFSKKKLYSYIPSYFKYFDKHILLKSSVLICICLFLLVNSFSWMYDEYNSNGAQIAIGSINHAVKEYDGSGNLVSDNDDTMSLIYESNMSSLTKGSRFIEIKNTGTLNMEYSLTFSVEGNNIGETGIMYYRLYEITEDVLKTNATGAYDTKLKAYAHNNPVPNDIETNTANPIYNLTTLNNKIVIGEIDKSENEEKNSAYYRLDYGIYSGIDSSIYSNASMSLHMNVYSSQVGTLKNELAVGKIWEVSNEEQFRAALQGVYPGDTIRLLDDIYIDGTVEFNKRVSLDTNEQLFKVSGDLVYDFVNMGQLNIDVTGSGRLEVGNNLYINTPKAEVSITGANKASDVVVGGKITFNGIQDGEKDGILLDNVRIVKNTTSYIPVDFTLLSNTRLTIAPNVEVGFIYANTGSTNIEIVNNGTISQIQLQNMSLLDTFTKPQIYIYNLGEILGAVGSSSIILPATATPYKGANDGNTLIVKGVTSSDITVSGSESFNNSQIDDITEGTSVIPFENEDNAFHVYLREPTDTIEGLLAEYFEQKHLSVATETASIKKLAIYTLNAQYIENEDFDFLKSDKVPVLQYLDMSSARVIDNTTVNRIKSGALQNKNSLKQILLPKTITEIGANAFNGIDLGSLSIDPTVEFSFINIPSSVDVIESNAFATSKYIRFEGQNPPRNIAVNAFNTQEDGAKMFVPEGSEEAFKQSPSLNETNIFRHAQVSDNRRYFVYEVGENLGISYIINDTLSTSSLGIPNQLAYLGANKSVVELGPNSYRHIKITNEDGVTTSIPSSIKTIGDYAFYGLNITTADFANVETVGNYAFYNTKIDSIIGLKIKEIGDYAFYNSVATRLSLRDIETIGDYAFANSQNLFEIDFGNIKSIGNYAFYDCKNISKVYFKNTDARNVNNKEEINISVGENALFYNWGYYIDGRLRVYVPSGNSQTGSSYVSLYKDKFGEYENYVYETGIEIGTYKHMEVPYTLSEYTVKEKTLTTPSGNVVVGLEIISYQGADIANGYNFPNRLTVDGRSINVISIGDNAYRNAACSNDANISIVNDSIVNIGAHAFQGIKVSSITASSVETIGDYAFSESSLNKGIFRSLVSLGDYALANLNDLYVLDLGPISTFGYNCISNDRYLEQLFIRNTVKNVVLNGEPFSNLGTNTNGRLRIYVPDIDLILAYYKELIPDYEMYIYPTGRIEGSFINSPIDYDIGEYSLREKTITKKDGTIVTGYELIEYHGADLNPGYNIPEEIDPVSKDIQVEFKKTNCWNNNLTCQYDVTIKNNSDNAITSWELTIPMPAGSSFNAAWGCSYSNPPGFAILRNANYSGSIPSHGSVSGIGLQINRASTYDEPEVSKVSVDLNGGSSTLPIISVGDYAYYHARTLPGFSFSVENNSILFLGKGAFEGNSSIDTFKSSSLETIGENAFNNSSLSYGKFDNLHTVQSNAFSNANKLYYLDLGTVKNMSEKAVANDNNLFQLYFQGTSLDVDFHSNAIYNVGSLTGNRFRAYVEDGTQASTQTYAASYGEMINAYQTYFYPLGDFTGSYTPESISYDIGTMTVRQVRVRNRLNVDTIGWEVVEYHGPTISGDFTLPNSVSTSWGTYPIVSIGKNAFRNSQIADDASITLPNGVINVDEYAFYGTPIGSLTGSNVETIQPYAFSECQNLTAVTLNNIVRVKSYAFYNDQRLTDVTLSSSTEEIEDYAFFVQASHNNLKNLYISIPKPPAISEHSLPELGGGVETTIYVPFQSMNHFQKAAIWKNYEIKNIGSIYNNTYIYESLGSNQVKLTGYLGTDTSLSIPAYITVNGTNNTVTEIDGSMFNDVTSVKTLTLPSTLKSVGDDFLNKNTSIATINVDNNNTYFKSINGVLFNKAGTTLVRYPTANTSSNYTVPNGTMLIKSNAFTNAFNLAGITFNSDLLIISGHAFDDCISLTTINFNGTQVPYMTAFDILPVYNNTKINVPKASVNNYKNDPFFYKYANLIKGR